MIPLRIEIPESKKGMYEENGWMLDTYTCARDHAVRMTYPNELRPYGIHKLRDIEKCRLWFIQTGRINPLWKEHTRIMDRIQFNRPGLTSYGQEEMQFSLSVAQALHFDSRIHVLDPKCSEIGATDMFERPLFILTWMSDADLIEYEIELAELAGDASLSHGAVFFHWGTGFNSPRFMTPESPPDFWWDFRNHTFFTYNEDFLQSFFLNLKSF